MLFYQKVSQLSCLRLCFGPLKMYRLFFCKNQQEIDPLSECTLKALESNANPSYFAAKSTESCHQEIWGPLVYLGRVVFFPHDKTNAWNALLNFRLKFRSVFQAKIVMIIHNLWLMWPSITTSIKDIPPVKASLPWSRLCSFKFVGSLTRVHLLILWQTDVLTCEPKKDQENRQNRFARKQTQSTFN